jgi:hypothetical protein
MPTIDDYRTALIRCVADKASDWKAACESAEAASKQIGQLQSKVERLRFTDLERASIMRAIETLEGVEYIKEASCKAKNRRPRPKS